MGDIVGGLIGAAGSLFGGKSSKSADLTGYNYLTSGGGAGTINAAQRTGQAGMNTENAVQGTESALLTGGPNAPAAKSAYNNYLNSTGYQFQQQQGTQAITGSAAARGILNSGATAKALTKFGQGLGGSYFNNYLGQLGTVNNQAQASANAGIGATTSAGAAGTQGGTAAGAQIASPYGPMATATGMAASLGTAGYNYFGGV